MIEDILNNAEYIYSSTYKWSLKRHTCDVEYYTESELPDLDFTICSIVNTGKNGVYDKISLGILLGFSLLDNSPEQYYDKCEEQLFNDLLSIVEKNHLIDIDNATGTISITKLGQISLKSNKLYRFHKGCQCIYEHKNISYPYPTALMMFPFYMDMGIYTELHDTGQIWPADDDMPAIFARKIDPLLKRIQLNSNIENHIYKASIRTYYDVEEKNIPIRLYAKDGEYIPVAYNGDRIAPLATKLFEIPENSQQKEKAILECLFKKLWDNPESVLNYKSLEPYFNLIDYEELTKDARTVWADERLFRQIAEMANSNCWLNISNNCDMNVLYGYLSIYSENLNWGVLTARASDDFIRKHFNEYPWDLEILSTDTSRDISFVEELIVSFGKYSDEWDWESLGERLEKPFVLANLHLVNIDLTSYTEDTTEVRASILLNPDRKWDWRKIENEFNLNFLLDNISTIQSYIGFTSLFDRLFLSPEWTIKALNNVDFRKVIRNNILNNGRLSSLSFNLKEYVWSDDLIDLFSLEGLLRWPSTQYSKGFECNPTLHWTADFFARYAERVTTLVGKKYVSAHIEDESIVEKFRDFDWEWSELSLNPSISTEFIIKNQKFPWDWSALTERMYSSLKNYNGIGHPAFINKWNWSYLSAHLPEDFAKANLGKYANHWDWQIIINRLVTKDKRLDIAWLSVIATAVNRIDNQAYRNNVWTYFSEQYTYEEFITLLCKTNKSDIFFWDLSVLYNSSEFDVFSDIEKYRDFIDWNLLSMSEAIDNSLKYNPKLGIKKSSWDDDVKKLIIDNEDLWDFKGLSTFESLNDKSWFLSKYAHRLDWGYLSAHSPIFATPDKQELNKIINGYKIYICFEELSKRKDVNIEQIIKIAPDENYDYNSLIANDVIKISINEVENKPSYAWNWKLLSSIETFIPTVNFLQRNFNKGWDWEALSKRDLKPLWSSRAIILRIASDDAISSTIDWITLTGRKYFPAEVSVLSQLPLEKINWEALSQHDNVMSLIPDFADYLDWHLVSKNPNLNVSDIAFLKEYADDLDWKIISSRKDFIFTEEILDDFTDRVDWTQASRSESIEFSPTLIDKYESYWDWAALANNKACTNRVELNGKKYYRHANIIAFINAFKGRIPRAYHFTHISNAVSIIKNMSLQSRNRANGKFSNSAGTNVSITDKAHDFARFYFISQSPTQFYNECLGKDIELNYYDKALGLGLPKCPMPVFFVVDIEELLAKFPEDCYYSTGNMQKQSSQAYRVIDNPNHLLADEIYDNYNKDAKQQEFLVKDFLDLSELSSLRIFCYDTYQQNMLKGLVGQSSLKNKIGINPSLYYGQNKQLYFDEDRYTLKIESNYKNPFEFRVEYFEDVPDIINKTSILREKGRSIYVGTNLEIRKDKPFKIYFEVYEPRQGSWLIYLNKDNGIKY